MLFIAHDLPCEFDDAGENAASSGVNTVGTTHMWDPPGMYGSHQRGSNLTVPIDAGMQRTRKRPSCNTQISTA